MSSSSNSSSSRPSSAPNASGKPRVYRFDRPNPISIEKQVPVPPEIMTVLQNLIESGVKEFPDLSSGGLMIHDNQAFIPPANRSIEQFCLLLLRPPNDFPFSFQVDKSSSQITTARQIGRIANGQPIPPRNAMDDTSAFQLLYQVLREADIRSKIQAVLPDDVSEK